MGNVLANISKDNTRFTIFENDQVLTAGLLNDLFNYLDVQSRITRTRAIGIGIICGLEIGQLEDKSIAVSKGSAITTDGDLLHFDADQEFDLYEVFEDANARYPYFRMDNDQVINMYELKSSGKRRADNVTGQSLAAFERTTNTAIKDYAGILYLEDYTNDPDVCTGTDCDNKGAESIRETKVLLIHKNDIRLLLESLPGINKNYFALDDIAMPRVSIKTGIDTYQELNAAFSDSLSIKEEIKSKLAKAYQVCSPMLEDEFNGVDPTSNWSSLLDEHFKNGTTIYAQYVYDFAKDISYAYNEMRETLFADNMLCCPDVQLFPKHVLMGLVKPASITRFSVPITSPLSSPISIINIFSRKEPIVSKIHFDIGSVLQRFHSIHIDLAYRHHFYESPVLNNKEENIQQTRFCFMRINAMITNFKIPVFEEQETRNQSIKITPSHFEDKPLGERSIPYYYSFNSNLPLNLYWNFKANIRKKENQIYWYSANQYAADQAALSPLLFNILPYNFFRIEGHIGLQYTDVETALNNLILANNLPVNIISVQVGGTFETTPNKPWFFPYLHMYEKAQQMSFINYLDKTDTVNDELKVIDNTIQVSEFKTAKQTAVMSNKDVSDPAFNLGQLGLAVSNVITAASNVKAQTKQYTFSNAATPHDFVNNTDILQKMEVISNIYQQQIIKKKSGLLLGNFMKANPGLEHAGGVVRGGTFVLVYSSEDQKVVADFMLPYASIDKDITVDPPVYKPVQTPPVIKYPIETVFEIKPAYTQVIDQKVAGYAKLDDLDKNINEKLNTLDLKLAVQDAKIENLGKTNSDLFDKVLTTRFTKDAVTNPNPNALTAGNKDFTTDVNVINSLQQEAERLAVDSPERLEKEKELLSKAEALTQELNKPEITGDKSNAMVVNSILSNVYASTGIVQSETLKSQASEVASSAGKITRTFNLNR